MDGLKRNWKELVVPVLLILLAAWIFGAGVAIFGTVMLIVGMMVGATWI